MHLILLPLLLFLDVHGAKTRRSSIRRARQAKITLKRGLKMLMRQEDSIDHVPNIVAITVGNDLAFSRLCYIYPVGDELKGQRWGMMFEVHDKKRLIPLWAACNKNQWLEGAIDSGRFASTGSHARDGDAYIYRMLEGKFGDADEVKSCSKLLNRLFGKLMDENEDFKEVANKKRTASDELLLIKEFCKYSRNIDSLFGPPDHEASFVTEKGTLKKYNEVDDEEGDYNDDNYVGDDN